MLVELYINSGSLRLRDYNHGLEEQTDCLGYRNIVRGLSYTFVRVTENKRISLVVENVNIVKFWSAKFR